MARLKQRYRGSVTQNAPSRREKPQGLLFKVRVVLMTTIFGFFVILSLWMWISGWGALKIDQLFEKSLTLTQKAGYAVTDIVVEGRRYTEKDDLFKALGVASGYPVLVFDAEKAHARLAKLPWIASATIERRLPGTLYIRLTERQPMARWQHGNVTEVIDREGKVLSAANPERFSGLLLVAGDNAPEQTADLLLSLKNFPNILARVKGAVRVGERRWNLHLDTGHLVRLPEHNMPDALKRLEELITEQNILDRGIASIDMRVQEKVILDPDPETTAGGHQP